MNKQKFVKQLLGKCYQPVKDLAKGYAPTNIALVKYWGKRDNELNIPVTDSLSIALQGYGSTTELNLAQQDSIMVNNKNIDIDTSFYQRLFSFVDLFRGEERFAINISTNVPIAAGLASSACGFSAITLALAKLYNWELDLEKLSQLARLGSGSAARSLWHGFVYWQAGQSEDGFDCYAYPISTRFDNLCIGLLTFDATTKPVSSRDAMYNSVQSSIFYKSWPNLVAEDIKKLQQAIIQQDFNLLGKVSESNALAMHAIMLNSEPPIMYSQPATILAMQKVWNLRKQGLNIYFTQDAGPNLKIIMQQQDIQQVSNEFKQIKIVYPFNSLLTEQVI